MRRWALAVWHLAYFMSCSLDREPRLESHESVASPGAAWAPELPQRANVTSANASAVDAAAASAPVVQTAGSEATASQDAGTVQTAAEPAAAVDASMPATATASDPQPADAGPIAPRTPVMAADPQPSASATPCQREELRLRAEAYLAAMASGKTDTLTPHPSLHYTENGQDERLGLGLWLSRPKAVFSRHALDEQRCSSATEAVLSTSRGDIIFALRLRHVDDKLIDVEAQVIHPSVEYYNPKAIIVTGDDPWVQPVAANMRQDATVLTSVLENFLESAIEPSLMPPAAPGCQMRQNGVDSGLHGSGQCVLDRDGNRLEQARYPLVDTTTGVVTAIGRRRGFLFMFFAKVQQNTLYGLEIVGGVPNTTTGW